jgi:hypothetical protein
MVQQSSNNLYGFPQPLTRVFPAPITAQRAPTSNDISYPIGQLWVDEVGDDFYGLTDVTAGSATWAVLAAVPGEIATLTGDSGGAITPNAGNIDLLGTANQITTTGTANTITLSLPSAITAPGSLTTTTSLASTTTMTAGTGFTATTGNITATAGNLVATNGNLNLNTAGNKINIATGANASIGVTAAMVAGTVTVNTTAVTANSLIVLQHVTAGGTMGNLTYGSIVAGTSFVITSDSNTDTSTVLWWIVN